MKNKSVIYGISIFFTAFTYLLLWIWQGIDFTDAGMNLTKQWLVVNGKAADYLDMLFGSYFIGGLWNSILGSNYLIWAYFGSVLIGSLSALLVYLIIKDYFSEKLSFFSVLVIIPLLFVPTIKVPNYNDIPTLLFLLMVYLISRSKNIENLTTSNILLIISGIVYSIALISRFMLLAFLLFPLVLIIYNFTNSKNRISWLKRSLFFLAGLVIGTTIIFLVLNYYGLLNRYLNNIYNNIFLGLIGNNLDVAPLTFTHSISSTVTYTLRYFYYSLILLPASILILSIASGMMKIRKRLLRNLSITLFIIITTFLIYKYLNIYGYYNYIYYIIYGFNILIIFIYIFKNKNDEANSIALLILFSQLIINFGSLVMNWTNMYLSTAFSIVLLFNLSDIDFGDRFQWFYNFFNLKKVIIIIIILLGISTNFFNTYRDSQDRFKLTNVFETESLYGVFSGEERVAAVDGLINELKNHLRPGDEVLFINNIPLLYYLTETYPATIEPWILNFSTDEAFFEEIGQLFKFNPPENVIIAKGSTRRDREWPENINTIGVHERNKNKLSFLYRTLGEASYKKIWENNGFEVFKKS